MSARDEALDQVRAAAGRIAAGLGLDIFDVQFRRETVGWVLRVVLDRVPAVHEGPEGPNGPNGPEGPEGVSVEDCCRVSVDVSAWLDVEDGVSDALGKNYVLEVSSPGLDRPVRDEADFRRFRGRLVKLVTREPIERQSSFAGRIAGVDDGAVIVMEGRRTHRVPLSLITRARLEVEF